jgi:hypothetical protein
MGGVEIIRNFCFVIQRQVTCLANRVCLEEKDGCFEIGCKYAGSEKNEDPFKLMSIYDYKWS